MGPTASPASKAVRQPLSSLASFPASILLIADISLDADFPNTPYSISTSLPQPLPPSTSALVMPHESFTLRGGFFPPALLACSDTVTTDIEFIPNCPISIQKGEVIGKLLVLPPVEPLPAPTELLAITKTMQNSRPAMEFHIKGLRFSGILDTGADVSVIRTAEWPAQWPLEPAPAVRGVGGTQAAQISKDWLSVTSPQTSAVAHIKPVILPLHINLWGRDLMHQFGAKLSLE